MTQTQTSFRDYDGFVEKFKPKKTADDCYTPSEVYEVVKNYVCERWNIGDEQIEKLDKMPKNKKIFGRGLLLNSCATKKRKNAEKEVKENKLKKTTRTNKNKQPSL